MSGQAEPSLSIINEHYLKRELIRLQIDHEVEKLNDFKNLGQLGPPFIEHHDSHHKHIHRRKSKSRTSTSSRRSSRRTSISSHKSVVDDNLTPEQRFPILRHFFVHRIKTFPFLGSADDVEFWQKKVQPFIESFAEKDISTTADREEATKRRRMGVKIMKMIQIYAVSGIHTTRPEEHDVKVETISQRGIQEVNETQIIEKATKTEKYINGYKINILGVRKVTTRKGFFTDSYYQYIIDAGMEGAPSINVARSYSDFKELDRKLHKEFPGRDMPVLPARNKVSGYYGGGGNGLVNGEGKPSNDDSPDNDSIDFDDDDNDDNFFDDDAASISTSKKKKTPLSTILARTKLSPSTTPSQVPREKQRIVLRAYLHKLLEFSKVTKSPAFLEFLFKDRIRQLSPAEKADIAMRKQMDLIRIEEESKFLQIAKERAKKLEVYITEFKQELLQKDGLANIFRQLKLYRRVEDMTPKFQKFIEWVLIEFAATLYSLFVAQDNSPELFSQVKRIHMLMPYSVLKGILRISNPVSVMKGLIDLFLAQPFGKRSLMQNLMLVVLADDMKSHDKLINEIKVKMALPELVEVFEEYVDADLDVHNYIHRISQETDTDLVMQIYRLCGEVFNYPISHDQLQTVEGWYKDWKRREEKKSEKKGEKIDSSLTSEADSYDQLKEIYTLIVRKRDKDMMQLFWEDSITVQFLKQLVTVFYSPLIQVFKSAKIYESVGDFEKFMNDLVKTVGKAEQEALSADPNQTVQQFIDLCKRHQNSIIKFINEVYINDNGLFDGILLWMSDIIEFFRNGPKVPLDMVGLVEKSVQDNDISIEIINKEMESIQQWIRERREWRDRKVEVNNEWSSAMPANGMMDGGDFGLSGADLEQFNPNDESDDEDECPQRPELKETPKLLTPFHNALVDVLKDENIDIRKVEGKEKKEKKEKK